MVYDVKTHDEDTVQQWRGPIMKYNCILYIIIPEMFLISRALVIQLVYELVLHFILTIL